MIPVVQTSEIVEYTQIIVIRIALGWVIDRSSTPVLQGLDWVGDRLTFYL